MNNIDIKIQRLKRSGGTSLDISGTGITFIPAGVFSLSLITELNLSDNRLIKIDDRIEALTNLKVLDLRNNSLAELPSSLANIRSLKEVKISGNRFGGYYIENLKKSSSKLASLLQNEVKSSKDNLDDLWDDEDDWGTSGNKKGGAGNDDFDFGFDDDVAPKKTQKKQKKSSKQSSGGLGGGFDFGSNGNSSAGEVQKLRKMVESLQKKNKELENKLIFGEGDNTFGADFGAGSQTQEMQVSLSEVKTQKKISQGGFSIVEWGFFRGTQVAVKKIFDPTITDDLMDEIQNEINMLNQLRHPNIILMMAYSKTPPDLFMVFELCKKGSVYDVMHKTTDGIEEHRKKILVQTARALNYMHKSKVVHRDIKTMNILLDDDFNVKLCDFGIAKNYSDLNKGGSQFVGTPCYMSPEQFEKRKYDHKVDVFAFGAVIYELYTKQIPFEGVEPMDVKERIMAGKDFDLGSQIPAPMRKLIQKCRAFEARDRPEFDEIINDLMALQQKSTDSPQSITPPCSIQFLSGQVQYCYLSHILRTYYQNSFEYLFVQFLDSNNKD